MYSLYIQLDAVSQLILFVDGLTLVEAHAVLSRGLSQHLFVGGYIALS